VRRRAILILGIAGIAGCIALAMALGHQRGSGEERLAPRVGEDAVRGDGGTDRPLTHPLSAPPIISDEVAARLEADAAPAVVAGGQLRVRVVSGARPLTGAEVHAYRREGRQLGGPRWVAAASASTGPDGTAILTAAPGAYTAVVSSANHASGTVLVEVYEVQ